MSEDIKLTVIVCTYNRANLLQDCLQSLSNQTIGKSLYEVVVVINNSTDNSREVADDLVKRHTNFRVVEEDTQGLSHARNRGYREAWGEYVAYIDDDGKAFPDWAERILRAFETVVPEPVAVGGMILPLYKKSPPLWFTDDLEIRTWGDKKGFLQLPYAPYGFSGSNMAFRRSILESYGGFSTDFGMDGDKLRFGEDAELFSRIYSHHPWFWYDPDIKVQHLVPERNMKISYRIKRAYFVGISNVIINRQRSAPNSLTTSLPAKLKNLYYSYFTEWGDRKWQRNLLKCAEFVASTVGYLKGKKFKL